MNSNTDQAERLGGAKTVYALDNGQWSMTQRCRFLREREGDLKHER